MPSVIVAGAGLAGLAAAAALADAGFEVDVYDARPYPGGRAASYTVPSGDGTFETVDNCQHILLRCCVNLLDFYRRLGISAQIDFHREFYWIEPGGRTSTFRAGALPAPAHFAGSFLGLKFLRFGEKMAVARGMLAVMRERRAVADLDAMSMQSWLEAHGQSQRVIDAFWRQVLVSAINEDLDRMSAFHGVQVFRLGFLASRVAYEMGVPSGTLGDLYAGRHWRRWPNIHMHFRRGVANVNGSVGLADGEERRADYYVVAVPFEHVSSLLPGYQAPPLAHSPITGVHLWFDRSVMTLPHATLLGKTIQWVFNKGSGRQLQLVISASRALTTMSRGEVVDLCLNELQEFFPAVHGATLLKAHVVKEMRATFSASPGKAAARAGVETARANTFVAGDWTWTGWPSTMESAVRSGYAAAEAVCSAAGLPARFVLPDIA